MKRVGVLFGILWAFQAHAADSILQLNIDGVIHEGTVHTIEQSIIQAKNEKAQALLITLDTPGGLLDSTREIVKLFLNEDFPIIVFVSPSGSHAGSAGTFITLAAHVAAMAPGTNIGAAHPVSATGKDPEEDGKHMAEKIENDTLAFMQSIATQRNRNTDWAKKAVLESASIGEDEAKKIGVIDIVAIDVPDLLKQLDGRKIKLRSGDVTLDTKNAKVEPVTLDMKTRLLNFLAHPTTMMLLMTIIGLGIYVEFSHPGLILPAAASIIAIFLLLIATSIIPITKLGLILVFLGFACFFFELYVVSYGALTFAGLALFVSGSLLLFDPSTSDLSVPHSLLWSISTGVAIVATFVAVLVGRTIRQPQSIGLATMIGTKTKIIRQKFPGDHAKIFIQGEYWSVQGDDTFVDGDIVEIAGVNGLTVIVKRAT